MDFTQQLIAAPTAPDPGISLFQMDETQSSSSSSSSMMCSTDECSGGGGGVCNMQESDAVVADGAESVKQSLNVSLSNGSGVSLRQQVMLNQFVSITGCTYEQALQLLISSEWQYQVKY